MIMVAIGTFEWISFRIINKMLNTIYLLEYWWPLLLLHNLALAVLIRVIISALVLHGRVLNAFVLENTSMRKEQRIRAIFGFTILPKKFDVIDDPEEVIVDFRK
jgi:SulP family sulfate permease